MPNISFVAHENQNLGFSNVPDSPWEVKFPWVKEKDNPKKHIPVKILAKGETDWIKVLCSDSSVNDWNEIDFYFGPKLLIPKIISGSEVHIRIINPSKAFELGAYFNEKPIARLRTIITEKRTHKVIVVPLVKHKIDASRLSQNINQILHQANSNINLLVQQPFSSKVFDSKTVFGIPDWDLNRYTGQMRLLRDQYFDKFPFADKQAHYIFLIPSFIDSSKMGYMIPYKAMGFVPYQMDLDSLSIQFSRTLTKGMGGLEDSWTEGPMKGSSNNLMDTTLGTELEFFQIEKLQHPHFYFSVTDAYEFVKTGNGTVGYYFWEEDKNGNVKWNEKSGLSALKTPFKRNFLAYRFNLESPLMRPLFRWGKYYISFLNFAFVIGMLFLLFFVRWIIKRFWVKKGWPTFPRRLLFWIKLGAAAWVIFLSFAWGNSLLDQYTLLKGPLPEFKGKNYYETKKGLFSNSEFRKKSEYGMSSEVLIQEGEKWRFKRLKRVLYFEIKNDKSGKEVLRYKKSSDKLKLSKTKYKSAVQNHYMVFSKFDEDGELLKEEVFSYGRKRINNIEAQENPPRRILVFVNGYRPTSTGKTLEENFKGIQERGFEYPNSTNHVYDFDRYEYWEPWGEINLKFQSKINPSATFYADGHFSVSTSDYKSLLNFSRISQAYPKRCENPKKHVCREMKNDNFWSFLVPTSKTENVLKMSANSTGFKYRKDKGKIAGWNMLQELNLYPNFSENDTLFIVTHSMGFAYSLGMIETMRKKISFGGFYIIAPENGKSGRVRKSEWQQIWQYGSNFNTKGADAPCLQDGVAPQSRARGIKDEQRVYIPSEFYNRRGFFDSHFIGYYDWVLKLEEKDKGYVKQR